MKNKIDLYDYFVSNNLAIAKDVCVEDFPNQFHLHNISLEYFEIDGDAIEICLSVYSKVMGDRLVAGFDIKLGGVADKSICYTDDIERLISVSIDKDIDDHDCTKLLLEVNDKRLVLNANISLGKSVDETSEQKVEKMVDEKASELSYPSKWVFDYNHVNLEWQWIDSPNSNKIEDYSVNADHFLEWRFPRQGDKNPTKMNSNVWEWLVHSKLPACLIADEFNLPTTFDEGPGWCFDRFGQTVNLLADRSLVYIAGEHEDWYDHNFFIYNDVVVVKPDQSVVFYCYPKDIFSPTDFHTATLVGDKIVIIGNLGYDADRDKHTQIYVLDLHSYAIQKIAAVGSSPGWIHKHKATLDDDHRSIVIEDGLLEVDEKKSLRENFDDWRLWLDDWRWEKLTDRQWIQWAVVRSDKKRLHFREYRQALWAFDHGDTNEYQKDIEDLKKKLTIDPDIQLITKLYQFSMVHNKVEADDEEYNVFWVEFEGVKIKFVEQSSALKVTIQGYLADETVRFIQASVIDKVSVLENVLCENEVYE
ncbi:hypothetical protein MNBD_GAMMA12-3630 [hydrothermal vent metagenome]|uniref:Uncharacterized protein n=1 Tax=hydrothermal vent metagenome TaxID=652676 RepID=A0A3B0Y973_9ZZZZ